MKKIFKVGDSKSLKKVILEDDVAAFNNGKVHDVCSTFTLAREIEWATRQYVLEMLEEQEEGIGTFLSINHKNPAFVGETIDINSKIESIVGNELICNYEVSVGNRIIAEGKTGQKILLKEKIENLFSRLKGDV